MLSNRFENVDFVIESNSTDAEKHHRQTIRPVKAWCISFEPFGYRLSFRKSFLSRKITHDRLTIEAEEKCWMKEEEENLIFPSQNVNPLRLKRPVEGEDERRWERGKKRSMKSGIFLCHWNCIQLLNFNPLYIRWNGIHHNVTEYQQNRLSFFDTIAAWRWGWWQRRCFFRIVVLLFSLTLFSFFGLFVRFIHPFFTRI